MKKPIDAESNVAPNLVPMVDIMFLLLLFLMLGADIGQRELEEVQLPLAQSVKAEDERNPDVTPRLTVNVYHVVDRCPAYATTQVCDDRAHWSIGIRGRDYREGDEVALKAHLTAEATREREQRGETRAQGGFGVSELRVMIRADRAALYEMVQRALNACAESGLYRIEIGAAAPLE